jgi:hypothetical protein
MERRRTATTVTAAVLAKVAEGDTTWVRNVAG